MTEDEMGGSCGTHGVEEKWLEGSGREIRKKETA